MAAAAAADLARAKALYPEAFVNSGMSSTQLDTAAAAGIQPGAGGATLTPGAVTAPADQSAGLPSDIVVTGDRSDLTDNRLRISALKGQQDKVYGPNDKSSNILAPLHATGGMMFPYTPSVGIAGDTDWTPHALTHTNYDIYSYQRTPSATITLSGKFTVQNQREGEYALACIHFLRTMGKMYYGELDSADYGNGTAAKDATSVSSNAGLPPPVLRLRGYGLYMFQDLKCVLKGYSFNFEENMDLVTIQSSAGSDIMLPPMFTINVTLLLQQNPTRLRKEFKLDDFRTGALMRQSTGGGWF
jgi:hypothetical protein